MSINFEKYQNELIAAWKEVLDDKSPVNWAIFGYEKNTNALQVTTKGTGSLEELANQFTVGQIEYAFCRYTFDDSDLPKFFIIHWVCESAPPSRKLTYGSHINSVVNFFRRSSMTYDARSEEDLEPSIIKKKLEKLAVRNFCLKERCVNENTTPVGTNYKRIQPQKEINTAQRESFWSDIQAEEKKRQAEEKKKLQDEKINREKSASEAQENPPVQAPEACAKGTTNKSDEFPPQQRKKFIPPSKTSDNETDEQKNCSKSIEPRKEEDTSLVKRRVEIFKKAFEEGKPPIVIERPKKALSPVKDLLKKNEPDIRTTDESNENVNNLAIKTEVMAISSENGTKSSQQMDQEAANLENQNENRTPSPENEDDDVKHQASVEGELSDDEQNLDELEEEEYLINAPEAFSSNSYTPQAEQPESDYFTVKTSYLEALEDIPEEREDVEDIEDSEYEKLFVEEVNKKYPKSEFGLRARALYDYQATDETEISFDPDDVITYIEKLDKGWWQGLAPDGNFGLFPAEYVQLID
ncbi:actin binding protein 1 [Brevipalpus obovatus]|uniref:actin binding protein 1 n=1 Tax=Brevipalpus obovatus TaxID=246614 RepID=UPI003D9F02D4